MAIKFLAALCALLIANGPAIAQPSQETTAKTVVDGCRTAIAINAGEAEPEGMPQHQVISNLIGAGGCTAFITGFVGGYELGSTEGKPQFCIPKQVSTMQIARLFVRRLDDRPEFEHMSAFAFSLGVLASTWPCDN